MADATSRPPSQLSWLPLSSSDLTPLASLSVCYINLNDGCNFHQERKQESYLRAWAHPAPAHCQRWTPDVPTDDIHADRLGIAIAGGRALKREKPVDTK